jgi:hypothetical protein
MEENGRREFFRIKDRLTVEFRAIDHEEYKRLESIIKYSSTQVVDDTDEVVLPDRKNLTAEEDRDPVCTILRMLDRKLDVILDLLSGPNGDEAYTRRCVDLEISGSGLKFLSDVPLKEGAYVEFKVILPVSPHPKVTALCQVVRAENHRVGQNPLWGIAMKFLTINEEDRDLLINYIFRKEREQIRQKKELTDN